MMIATKAPRARAKRPAPDYEAELAQQISAVGLPEPVTQFYFAKALKRRWRSDLAWPAPEYRVLLEVEGGQWLPGGGRHNRGSSFEADMEKYNTAALLGYLVIRVSPAMVRDGRALDLVQRALASRQTGRAA